MCSFRHPPGGLGTSPSNVLHFSHTSLEGGDQAKCSSMGWGSISRDPQVQTQGERCCVSNDDTAHFRAFHHFFLRQLAEERPVTSCCLGVDCLCSLVDKLSAQGRHQPLVLAKGTPATSRCSGCPQPAVTHAGHGETPKASVGVCTFLKLFCGFCLNFSRQP